MRHRVVEEDLAQITGGALPFRALARRRLLVTGAGGFLPAYLIETLLYLNETRGLGIQIVGLTRDLGKAHERFRFYRGRKDLHLILGDASRPVSVPGRVDHVLHAASQASPRYYGPDPVGTLAPNVLGTAWLLDLARVKKASFFFFSSSEVYGSAQVRRLKEEDAGIVDPLHPRACYAEAKRMGETMCLSWQRQHDVPARVARIFHSYGPGMALGDGRVFSDFVDDIAAGRDITVQSDGKAVRSYCYLSDTIAACLAILLKGKPGLAYNIGNEQAEASVLDLANRLARLFPEKRLRVAHEPPPMRSRYVPSPFLRFCPDTSRLRALGWRPRHGIESGFKRTVEFYS